MCYVCIQVCVCNDIIYRYYMSQCYVKNISFACAPTNTKLLANNGIKLHNGRFRSMVKER